jgi:hypothetical protein
MGSIHESCGELGKSKCEGAPLFLVLNTAIKLVVRNIADRVSSKQSNIFFGSNRNKPKLNLFRLFFGLFRETKYTFFRFVSVFRASIETTETNRIFSKQIETNQKNPPKNGIY